MFSMLFLVSCENQTGMQGTEINLPDGKTSNTEELETYYCVEWEGLRREELHWYCIDVVDQTFRCKPRELDNGTLVLVIPDPEIPFSESDGEDFIVSDYTLRYEHFACTKRVRYYE